MLAVLKVSGPRGSSVCPAGAAPCLVYVAAQVPVPWPGPLVLPAPGPLTLVQPAVEELQQPAGRLLSRVQQVAGGHHGQDLTLRLCESC